MYYSWIVHQLPKIGLLILLSIFTSRKAYIFAQDICEESLDVTTLVNSTVIFYYTLSDKTEFKNNSVVISWKPLHSQTIRIEVYEGVRINAKYNSTHSVNTSLPDQYDLVITNVQLQHAGKYIFKGEGGEKQKLAVLSVYENLPSCEIEDGSRLTCNITFAGVRTPELLCNITSKGETINKTFSFTNATEPRKNGTDYAINISLAEHAADILTLNCIISPTVKNSAEDWNFFYEWLKTTDEQGSSARHSIHATKKLETTEAKTDSMSFTSGGTTLAPTAAGTTMSVAVVGALSALGVIILITNIVILVLLVHRRIAKTSRRSEISIERFPTRQTTIHPEIRYTNHSRSGTLPSIAEFDGIYAEINSRPASRSSTMTGHKPDLLPHQHLKEFSTEFEKQSSPVEPPVYAVSSKSKRNKEQNSAECPKPSAAIKPAAYSEINKGNGQEPVYSYSEVKEVRLRWSLEAEREKEKEPPAPPILPYDPNIAPDSADEPTASDTFQGQSDQVYLLDLRSPNEYYDIQK